MSRNSVLTCLSLLLAIGSTIGLIVADYTINRDIEGWKTRAQVSSEPNDMYEYMSNVKTGMENAGMTSGYAALIFKTPENNMALVYRAVNQHVDQAKILTSMNRSSPEYQTGLDNLRGSIRELDLHAFYFWSVRDGLLAWIICIIAWVSVLIFGFLWLESN